MSRNGSGVYSLPAGNPVVTLTNIASAWANNTLNDIAAELTNSIDKGGRTAPTANLPMAGFKFTGAGAASAAGEFMVYGQAGVILDSPTFTGAPQVPTAPVDTNTGQAASTAFVINQGYLKAGAASGIYAPLGGAGASGTWTINVTGNSAYATNAGNANYATSAGSAGSANTANSATTAGTAGSVTNPASNGYGARTASTGGPSGGNDGDIHYQYT